MEQLNINEYIPEIMETPLWKAVNTGNKKCVIDLLHSHANPNKTGKSETTPLFIAAEKNHISILQQLLDAKADPNIPDKNGRTPLHIAAINGHEEIVDLLILGDADINKTTHEKETALLLATVHEHKEAVQFLLEANADQSIQDLSGNTPLHIATLLPDNIFAKYMLRGRSPVNIQNIYGETPLHLAAIGDFEYLVLKYLQAGANCILQDIDGCTATHYAAEYDKINALKWLLYFCQDSIHIKNTTDETPIDIAKSYGNHGVLKVLFPETSIQLDSFDWKSILFPISHTTLNMFFDTWDEFRPLFRKLFLIHWQNHPSVLQKTPSIEEDFRYMYPNKWVSESCNYVENLSSAERYVLNLYTRHGDEIVNTILRTNTITPRVETLLNATRRDDRSIYAFPLFLQYHSYDRNMDTYDAYFSYDMKLSARGVRTLNYLEQTMIRTDEDKKKYILQYAEELRKILRAGPKIQRRCILYRGVENDYIHDPVGSTVQLKGFQSTSYDFKAIYEFAVNQHLYYEFYMEPGSSCLCIKNISEFPEEKEILIDYDCTVHIQKTYEKYDISQKLIDGAMVPFTCRKLHVATDPETEPIEIPHVGGRNPKQSKTIRSKTSRSKTSRSKTSRSNTIRSKTIRSKAPERQQRFNGPLRVIPSKNMKLIHHLEQIAKIYERLE